MEHLFILAMILVFVFLITITIIYIFRPEFLIVRCTDPSVIEEIDMWSGFITALCVAVLTVILFTAVFGQHLYSGQLYHTDDKCKNAFEYGLKYINFTH